MRFMVSYVSSAVSTLGKTSLEKPLKGNKKVLEHLLMVGFYQLYAMRVADHAHRQLNG